jgi:hypothetical protein
VCCNVGWLLAGVVQDVGVIGAIACVVACLLCIIWLGLVSVLLCSCTVCAVNVGHSVAKDVTRSISLGVVLKTKLGQFLRVYHIAV